MCMCNLADVRFQCRTLSFSLQFPGKFSFSSWKVIWINSSSFNEICYTLPSWIAQEFIEVFAAQCNSKPQNKSWEKAAKKFSPWIRWYPCWYSVNITLEKKLCWCQTRTSSNWGFNIERSSIRFIFGSSLFTARKAIHFYSFWVKSLKKLLA